MGQTSEFAASSLIVRQAASSLYQGFLSARSRAHEVSLFFRPVQMKSQASATAKTYIEVTAAVTTLWSLSYMLTHSQSLMSGPDIVQRLIRQFTKGLRPCCAGMNNTLTINMSEAIPCLATAIFAAILLLAWSHNLPEEEVMNFHSRQLAGFLDKFQPDFPEGTKVLPTRQIITRIIVDAITDMSVWQLKFRDLMLTTKAQ